MSNIIGESFNPIIKDQINIRQTYYGDKNHSNGIDSNFIQNKNQLLYAKNPFIKLTSSVNVSKDVLKSKDLPEAYDGNLLAKNFVLFGGVSTQTVQENEEGDILSERSILKAGLNNNNSILGNQAYGLGGLEFGQVPMPGITQANITHKNRGSLREAQITLRAYNTTQLDILDLLYLRLGYTVLLEWGHSIYMSNNGSLKNFGKDIQTLSSEFLQSTTKNNISDYYEGLRKIGDKQLEAEGNYDAMLAKITNFNWSFNPDGSYDINITLISIGDVIESLKLNNNIGDLTTANVLSYYDLTKNPSLFKSFVESKIQRKTIFTGKVDNLGAETKIMYWFLKEDEDLGWFESNTSGYWTTQPGLNGSYDKVYQEAVKYWEPITKNLPQIQINTSDIDVPDSVLLASSKSFLGDWLYKVYLQTGIESRGNYFSAKGLKDSKGQPSHFVKFSYLLQAIESFCVWKYKAGGKTSSALKIDTSSQNYIAINPYTISGDYSKCLVDTPQYVFNGVNYGNIIGLPNPFRIDKKPGVGQLMNIYINVEFVSNLLNSDKDVFLYDVLRGVCDGINVALGGVNELEPVIDESSNTVKIIDSKPIPKKGLTEEIEPAMFQIYGFEPVSGSSSPYDVKGNFVKDFSIRSEITNRLATQLSIGAQSIGSTVGEDATSFQALNAGIIDRIAPEKVDSLSENSQTFADSVERFVNTINDFIKYLEGLKLWDNITNNNLSYAQLPRYSSLNKQIQNLYANKFALEIKSPSPTSQGFIPINLSLRLDGIAGMKIYQTFKVNSKFLPANYTKYSNFIIKKINHVITPAGWETQLETLIQPNVYSGSVELFTIANAPDVEDLGADSRISNPLLIGSNSYENSPLVTDYLIPNGYSNGRLDSGELVEIQGSLADGTPDGDTILVSRLVVQSLQTLITTANNNGFDFSFGDPTAGYRSFASQQSSKDAAIAAGNPGRAATPGSSAHGWGGAIDIRQLYRAVQGSTNPTVNSTVRLNNDFYKFMVKNAQPLGWYNPYRLADGTGTNEVWHWEYWGIIPPNITAVQGTTNIQVPISELNVIQQDALNVIQQDALADILFNQQNQ